MVDPGQDSRKMWSVGKSRRREDRDQDRRRPARLE